MRRKDRAMPPEFGLEVIDRACFGVLSLIDEDGAPYGIPLSLARDGNTLYFHSAPQGKRAEVLNKNPLVSIAFVGEVTVPQNYSEEELDEIIRDEQRVDLLLSGVFTTEFESAIVTGQVTLVHEEAEKVEALRLICQKYTPTKMAYFSAAAKAGLSKVQIYRVEITKLTAKRKKYDEYGVEMKWARLK